jgi:hypothetical protein
MHEPKKKEYHPPPPPLRLLGPFGWAALAPGPITFLALSLLSDPAVNVDGATLFLVFGYGPPIWGSTYVAILAAFHVGATVDREASVLYKLAHMLRFFFIYGMIHAALWFAGLMMTTAYWSS